MKKNLLSLAFSILASLAINAQTYSTTVYEPDDANPDWTNNYTTSSAAVAFTCDGLSFTPGGASFGALNNSETSFSDTDNNGNAITVTKTRYFAFGGNCYSGSTTPVGGTASAPSRRIVKVPIPAVPTGGKIILKAFGNISGTSGVGRQLLFVKSDGSSVLGSITYSSYSAGTGQVLKVELPDTFVGTDVILAGAVGDSRVWRIEVTKVTPSSLNTINANKSEANIFSSGKTVYVKNLTFKNANINIYNLNGSLIKSFKITSNNTQFELPNGLYIIKVKCNEGEKSKKVSVKNN